MKAQQEYESLTERIEAQKEKKLNRFIAALAAVIQESDEEPAKDTSSEEDDEDIVLISLFSLRIKTECELIREGSRDLVEQVKEDIEELVSHVQSFEYESTISEMVRSDAYDLLKSICLEEDRHQRGFRESERGRNPALPAVSAGTDERGACTESCGVGRYAGTAGLHDVLSAWRAGKICGLYDCHGL